MSEIETCPDGHVIVDYKDMSDPLQQAFQNLMRYLAFEGYSSVLVALSKEEPPELHIVERSEPQTMEDAVHENVEADVSIILSQLLGIPSGEDNS